MIGLGSINERAPPAAREGHLLPMQAPSKRIDGWVVLDFSEAKKRLRPEKLASPRRSNIAEVVELVEAWGERLERGEVNRADLAREAGVTRARITQLLSLLTLLPEERDVLRDEGVSVNEALRRAGGRRAG